MKKILAVTFLILLIFSTNAGAQNTDADGLAELSERIEKLEMRVMTLENELARYLTNAEQKSTADDFTLHSLGEEVKMGDRTVVLEDAKIENGILQLTFVVTNTGSRRIEVGGFYSFMAKNNEGEILESDYFNCNSNSLDTSLIPNDKVKGVLCFTYQDPAPVKIYYEPDPINEDVYVWQIQP